MTIAIEPHDARVTRVRLRMDPGRYSQVRGDGRVTRAGDRVTWEPPEQGGALHYRYKIDHERRGGGYDAKIGPHWAIVRGDDLVPAAAVTATRGAESRARLRFTLPEGLDQRRHALPARAQRGASSSWSIPKRRFDRPVGWIIAGEVGTRREWIDGAASSASPGRRASRAPQRHDRVRQRRPCRSSSARSARLPPKLLVVSAGDPMWRGGLSGPRSLFLHASRPLVSENGTSSLVHELFHAVTRIRGARGDDWIAEGLAEYYSIELPRRAGLLSREPLREGARVDAALLARRRAPARAPRRRAGSPRARCCCCTSSTARSRRAATARPSLDAVVRALIPIREVSLADLRAAAQRASGAPSKVLDSPLLAELRRHSTEVIRMRSPTTTRSCCCTTRAARRAAPRTRCSASAASRSRSAAISRIRSAARSSLRCASGSGDPRRSGCAAARPRSRRPGSTRAPSDAADPRRDGRAPDPDRAADPRARRARGGRAAAGERARALVDRSIA